MGRGISAAFTVFDRLLDPNPWRAYHVPADLEIPLLVSRPAGTNP